MCGAKRDWRITVARCVMKCRRQQGCAALNGCTVLAGAKKNGGIYNRLDLGKYARSERKQCWFKGERVRVM